MKGFMKKTSFLVLAAVYCASLVLAHGYVEYVVVDGKLWKDYNPYLDSMAKPQPERIGYSLFDNAPVYNPLSLNITCGFNPIPGPPKLVIPIKAGSNMTITWTTWPNNHIGSTMTYLAPCLGTGGCRDPNLNIHALKFFKIHQDGLHKDKTWFSEQFIKNNSTMSVTIPKDIPNGEYLVRHEQLSLHAVDNPEYGPEFYPSCFQISVTGGTGKVVPEGVLFPGAYKRNDPGITYDVYGNLTAPYIFPGPPLYNAVA